MYVYMTSLSVGCIERLTLLCYGISCTMCQGRGRVPCEVCLERGQLKWYIRLTVSWKAHRDEEEIEKTALPDELIKTAEGVVVMQEQQTRVSTFYG